MEWNLKKGDYDFENLVWTGYDDSHWWENVSNTAQFAVKETKNGRRFQLNPMSGEVTYLEK